MTTAAYPATSSSSSSTGSIRPTESWDNDDDLLFDDNESIGGDLKDTYIPPPRRKISTVHRSFSTLQTLPESDNNEDVPQQFELSTDDIAGALSLALKAGIPIPKDTPSSALVGGTINRLGSSLRKAKAVRMDDWSEDIEIPDMATLKLSVRQNTRRTPSPMPPEFLQRAITPLKPTPPDPVKDNFEEDFDIPPDMGVFELKSPTVRRDVTTPLPSDDLEDWAEGGSLGTRYAGTRRMGMLSDFSPSASSAITVESENGDPMDGLEFSSAHVNLQEILDRRMKERALEMSPTKTRAPQGTPFDDDLLGGLELDDEENPFQAGKLKANRNILHRLQSTTPSSPQRKVAVSVTFAEKPSKIPRPSNVPLQLPAPVPPSPSSSRRTYTHRPPSARLSDHLNEKTVRKKTSIANFSQYPSSQADSMRNRALGAKTSMPALRAAAQSPTRSSRQLPPPPPLPAIIPERAKSRTARTPDLRHHTESPRPRSPEHARNDSQSVRPAFIPGGASVTTSHHVAALNAPLRLGSGTLRSTSSSKRPMFAPENLRKEALRTKVLTTPRRIRDFGDGSELDAFDDLPVSHATEKKYRVQAKGVGTPNGVQRFNTLNSTVRKPGDGPSSRPCSRLIVENRREVVSRIDWKNPVATRSIQNTMAKAPRKLAPSSKQNTMKGRPKPPGKGPTLIKNLNSSHESRVHGKMTYNPRTHKWDGNEEALRDFDAIAPRDVFTPPRPALISNITSGSIRGVQVVGGMIFDPQRMCWLTNTNGENPDSLDEEDPFEGLEDLKDDDMSFFKYGSSEGGGPIENDDTVMVGGIGNDFEVDVAWKEKQVDWETRWRATMKGWNHGASLDRGEERRRAELFDIWHLANSSRR